MSLYALLNNYNKRKTVYEMSGNERELLWRKVFVA